MKMAHTQEVRGEGVIGQQPMIEPGASFKYTSAAPLAAPSGVMMGAYSMQRDHKRRSVRHRRPALRTGVPEQLKDELELMIFTKASTETMRRIVTGDDAERQIHSSSSMVRPLAALAIQVSAASLKFGMKRTSEKRDQSGGYKRSRRERQSILAPAQRQGESALVHDPANAARRAARNDRGRRTPALRAILAPQHELRDQDPPPRDASNSKRSTSFA